MVFATCEKLLALFLRHLTAVTFGAPLCVCMEDAACVSNAAPTAHANSRSFCFVPFCASNREHVAPNATMEAHTKGCATYNRVAEQGGGVYHKRLLHSFASSALKEDTNSSWLRLRRAMSAIVHAY